MSLKHLFGFDICQRHHCLDYITDHCYIYPTSRHLILYDTDYKTEQFISYGNECDQLELFSLSENKEYLAIVLKSFDQCRIVIYQFNPMITIISKKILSLKDKISSEQILSLKFSNNSKYLLAFYGPPDCVLVCWETDRWKLIGMISLSIDHPVHLQVSFNPNNSSQILITGNEIFRKYRFNHHRFSLSSQGQYQRFQSMNITCHCWIKENMILLGLDEGFIYSINNDGEILQRLNIEQFRQKSSESFNETSRKNELIHRYDIISLFTYSHGIFVTTRTGDLIIYERNEHTNILTYLRKYSLPSSIINDIHSKDQWNERIESLALSPNEEILLVGTNYNHLYQFSFSKINSIKKETNLFTYALDPVHNGAIRNGVLCLRKPMLFTLGIDRTLKIWNLQTNIQEMNKQFVDEPLSLSVHPSGIFVCISFWNMMNIYGYTIDGLDLIKEFHLSNVRLIEYSKQGHMLAIAYDNILQIHHHHNSDEIIHGRNNGKKFRLIRWSDDDTSIISVDFNDLIIRWDPYTGQALSEYQVIDWNILDLVISSDNKVAYLLGNDQKVKEFFLMTSIRDLNVLFDQCIPRSLVFDDQSRNLFIGSENGSIYSIKTNSIIDSNISHHLFQKNVHQGSIIKLLVSRSNDLLISMGEDGNIIQYNLNNSHETEETKILCRDEILAKENLLKEQNIELNNLIKQELEISKNSEMKIANQEEEYLQHLSELNLSCQTQIDGMQRKLIEFRQLKSHLNQDHQEQLNYLIDQNENSIKEYSKDKTNSFRAILLHDQFFQLNLKNFEKNQNEENTSSNDLYEKNLRFIHFSYRQKIEMIKNKFSQKRSDINERIDYLEEMKDVFDEQIDYELIHFHQNYQNQFRKILNQSEQLQNEQILFSLRLKQLEEESNRYEDQIKENEFERNSRIDQIRQIDKDLNLAKQTIQQRHFLIQEKLKRKNEMENRRDELEKFAYVFNYKIRELTNEIAPRQYEIQALIEQFNNMDKEFHVFNQKNEKYLIEISHSKAKLRAIDQEILNETLTIRKFNQTMANIKEDFKLCCHFLNRPKQLIDIIRKIYGKYFLHIDRNINSNQMNLFDCDRQRSYFERTYLRLQTKITTDIRREDSQQIKRIEEQINLMHEISSYSFKVVQLQRILTDLDIVSNLKMKINAKTSNQIIDGLKMEENLDFIQEKQIQFDSIRNKQEKRIQLLRNLIDKLQFDLQCGMKFKSISSFEQSNSIYSQTSF